MSGDLNGLTIEATLSDFKVSNPRISYRLCTAGETTVVVIWAAFLVWNLSGVSYSLERRSLLAATILFLSVCIFE